MTTGMEICAIFHWVSDWQMMVCRPARGSRRITISLLGGQRREPVVIDGHSDPLQDDQGDSDYPYSNRDHPKILRGALLRLRSGDRRFAAMDPAKGLQRADIEASAIPAYPGYALIFCMP